MRIVMAMTAAFFLTLLFAAVQSGCDSDDDTPAEVIEEHVRLLNERKFDEFYELHASGVLPSPEDVYLQEIEKLYPEGSEIIDVSIISEEIEGDRAKVTWSSVHRYPGQEEEAVQVTTSLVRQSGRWKIGEDTTAP